MDDDTITTLTAKLEQAKQEEGETEEALLRDVMIQLRMRLEGKKFSTLLKEEMKPKISLDRLEERLEKLRETRDAVKKQDDLHTVEKKTEKFHAIHSDHSLEALGYEVSRLRKLEEDNRL